MHWWRGGCGWVGEVVACQGGVEPEIGGGADGGLVGGGGGGGGGVVFSGVIHTGGTVGGHCSDSVCFR